MNKRKVKNNKYGGINDPKAELDFHKYNSLTPFDIEKICNEFIEESVKKNLDKILVITGKGLHSSFGIPVVKPTVVDVLKRNGKVFRFTEARRDRGGSGAFEVELRV